MNNKKNTDTSRVTFASIAANMLDHVVGGKAEPPGSEWVSKGDGTGMVVIRHPNGTISAGPTEPGK